MQETLTLTLVQFDIAWSQPETNRKLLDAIFETIPTETNLIILPEMFSTGFLMSPKENAEPANGTTTIWMQTKAAELNAAIVGSLIIEENGFYYNRILFVHPNGNVQIYDKRHLFSLGDEDKHYKAGNKRLIVDYLGWRICPLICYDLRFPVWAANKYEYDLLIYLANWPERRQQAWDILPLARAIENQSYVAAVNRVGKDFNELDHNGHSRVIDFLGNCIAKSGTIINETITACISLNKLKKFRDKYPFMKDSDDFHIVD